MRRARRKPRKRVSLTGLSEVKEYGGKGRKPFWLIEVSLEDLHKQEIIRRRKVRISSKDPELNSIVLSLEEEWLDERNTQSIPGED